MKNSRLYKASSYLEQSQKQTNKKQHMKIESLIYLQPPSWVIDEREKWKKIGSKEGRKLETVDHEVLTVPLRHEIFLKPSLAA